MSLPHSSSAHSYRMAITSFPARPSPSTAELKQFFVGKDINDVPKPAVVLDVAIIKKHCQAMLDAATALNVGFRAHVKTHKTPQATRLQVGESSQEVNLVISTVLEGEMLVPLLQEFQRAGRSVNVLYGIPLVPSQVPRLAALARLLGEKSISVMIDHPDQVDLLATFREVSGHAACIFLKVDSGYHRAGLPPNKLNKNGLLEKVAAAEEQGHASLLGLYSHNSLSYSGSTPEELMAYLNEEISSCREALKQNLQLLPTDRELVISVGATPQVVSSQHLLHESLSPGAQALRNLLHGPDPDVNAKVKVELHAGVYPFLDMQQLGTNVHKTRDAESEIGISVIAEVCSVYNNGERSQPEALVAAGSLALGREPAASYPGWGLIGAWRREPGASRLLVQRISQEHAIVAWEDESDQSKIPLKLGQSVKIFPNHACITGALYG
ncbi:D-serine ammonia-lyase DSD1, partial [Aspergillus brunneoviolaceus CBS 621.78]